MKKTLLSMLSAESFFVHLCPTQGGQALKAKGMDQKAGNHIVSNDDLIGPVFSGVEQHIGIILVVFKKATHLLQTAAHYF